MDIMMDSLLLASGMLTFVVTPMFVYPFESQIGTRLVDDSLTSMFPVKYRWPVFRLDASAREDYQAIIDEEGKVRARTPHVSKFRHMPFDFSDDERCQRYESIRRAPATATVDWRGMWYKTSLDFVSIWPNVEVCLFHTRDHQSHD
jgi:hypothetical protein